MFLLNSINLFLFIIDFVNTGIQLYMYTPIVGASEQSGMGESHVLRLQNLSNDNESFKNKLIMIT